MLPLLLQPPPLLLLLLLLLLHNSIYNIEETFELNQKTLCACTLSKERISRIDLGIDLELPGDVKMGRSSDQKPMCARYF